MKELVTPKQVAKAIGMSESSLKRWCDRGLIPTVRTAGGHRRIPINGVLGFIKARGFSIVDPEELGLPPATGQGERTLGKARDSLIAAYVDNKTSSAIRVVVDLFLANHSSADILDQVIQPAMVSLGDKWACGDLEVYEERRSVEMTSRVLYELRRLMPSAPPDAPLALGATLDGDPYTLASRMAEITVRDAGFRSVALGNGLPFETLYHAIENESPTLFWVSVSAVRDEDEFVTGMREMYQTCERRQTRFAVGGVALDDRIRKQLQYHSFCDTMSHLASYAASLVPSGKSSQINSTPRDDVADDVIGD